MCIEASVEVWAADSSSDTQVAGCCSSGSLAYVQARTPKRHNCGSGKFLVCSCDGFTTHERGGAGQLVGTSVLLTAAQHHLMGILLTLENLVDELTVAVGLPNFAILVHSRQHHLRRPRPFHFC